MRLMKKIVIILNFLFLILVFSLFSEKIVEITTLYNYPPFSYIEGSSVKVIEEKIPPGKDATELKGYSWDMVRESFHARGWTIKLSVVPWSRGMSLVENGTIDLIFPAVKNDERLERFYFSNYPTDKQNFIVYVNKDSDIVWEGLSSLKGKRIATVTGWAYGTPFDSADYIIKDPSSEIMHGFNKLRLNRVDGVVAYEITYDYVLRQEGLENEFKKLPPFHYINEYIMGLKTNENVNELLNEFDKGMEIIIENGTYLKIQDKWHITGQSDEEQ